MNAHIFFGTFIVLLILVACKAIYSEFTEWQTAYFCRACDDELTHNQYAYSRGRCPKCGVKGESAASFVDCYQKAVRWKVSGIYFGLIPKVSREYK